MAEQGGGLAAVLEAARAALRGEEQRRIMETCGRLRASLAATLLDLPVASRPELVEGYLSSLKEVLGVLADALAASGIEAARRSQLAACMLCGLLVGSEDCVLVHVREEFSHKGHVARRGAILCLPLPRALGLVEAGLAEPVPLLPGLCSYTV